MYKIKTLNKISKAGLSRLDTSRYICADEVEDPEVFLVRSASLHETALPESLLCIARAGAGVNNIPVDACSEAGVVVFNTPGANANAVKELVICALLLCSRDISGGIAWARGLTGEDIDKQVEKGKKAFVGPEIEGKTLGVIGLGAIGVMVANAAQRLGMNVFGFDPYISVDAAWGLSRSVCRAHDLKTIYENCDYITIHVPLNNETRGMLGAEAFSLVKKGVRVINLARGELVDNAAILDAMNSGVVSRYVTDFPSADLLCCDKVIPTPHLGASTPESEDNCAAMAVTELCAYLENGNITNSVNFPDVVLEPTSFTRLCLIHKNIPNMLGRISSAIAQGSINIENMLNRSKKEYAYTLLDISSVPDEALLNSIRAIEGIIRIRVIPGKNV